MQRAAAGECNQTIYGGGNREGEDKSIAGTADNIVARGTSGGAKVLDLDAIGTLTTRMAADIALYEADEPLYFALHDRGGGEQRRTVRV